MSVVSRIAGNTGRERASGLLFQDFVNYFQQADLFGSLTQTLTAKEEKIGSDFISLTHSALKGNPIIFGLIALRAMILSEAEFKWQNLATGKLFGDSALTPLESPSPGVKSQGLLMRAEIDNCIAGNFFAVRRPGQRIKRMRPDWTTIILGSDDPADDVAALDGWDIDAEIVAYAFQPGGPSQGNEPEFFLPHEVAHYAPFPDPEANFRGMSWLTPVIRDLQADIEMTKHKGRFLSQGATPNMIVKMPELDDGSWQRWVKLFREEHETVANKFRTLFLKTGMDATVVGTDFKTLDFAATQAAGEVRMAVAAGVPASVIGILESLKGSSLNAATYQGARRKFADGTMRPLWHTACDAFGNLVTPPEGARLWYDAHKVDFLQDDEKDKAEILSTNATSISTFVTAGYKPESAVAAVMNDDLSQLVHSGNLSVQLYPGGQPTPKQNAAVREAAEQIIAEIRSREH